MIRIGFMLTCFALAGCASIVSKSDYTVGLTSAPAGATVTVTDENSAEVYRGTTPSSALLKASAGYFNKMDYVVRYELECHDLVEADLRAGLDGWYLGNVIFGGLIGMLIVDPATGSMWRLDESVSAALPANQACAKKDAPVDGTADRLSGAEGG